MRCLQLLVFSTLLFGALHASIDNYPRPSPNQVATAFLREVGKAIESLNYNSVASLFQDDFYFTGCSRNMSKSQVVGQLTSLKGGTHIDLKILEANELDNYGIRCSLGITGIGKYFEAVFYLYRENGILRIGGGEVTDCARNFAPTTGDGSKLIVQDFSDRLSKIYHSGTVDDLAALFEDKFVLTLCDMKLRKKQIHGYLRKRSKDAWVSFYHFYSYKFIANDIIESKVDILYKGMNYNLTFKFRYGINSYLVHSAQLEGCVRGNLP
uniref:NTF2-like domain-containing protein n=1 Tax=Caenorhabditis japonica TaxID=281687 RepID=A0A8R1IM54_CAEJA